MPFLKDLPCEISIFGAHDLELPGWAVTPAVACMGGFRREMVGNGMQAEAVARPGPEGGRIEPAEPEPPPALLVSKIE